MGLHYHINYLVIICIVAAHVILHSFAFDFNSKFFTGLQHCQGVREKDQYLFNIANEKRGYFNKLKPLSDSLLLKWKTLEGDLNNNKNGKHLLRNLKADTKMQTTTTPLSKESNISLSSRYLSKSTTPSYIQFNYLNENQSQHQYIMKSSETFGTNHETMKISQIQTSKPVNLGPSMVSYRHFNEPYIRQDIMTPQKDFFSKNLRKPLYPYFQPNNNSKINKTGKPISGRNSINNMPLFGRNAVTVKADLRNTPVPNRTNVSDSITNIPFLDREAVTVKAHLRNTRIPTRTGVSDSIINIPLLGQKHATVKAYLRNTRMPTKTNVSDSINIPLLSREAAIVKAYLRNTRIPTRTNVSDSNNNIPLLGREATTVKVYFKSTRVLHRKSETAHKLPIRATMPNLTTVSTTSDDKVKFFEIYDTNTLKPQKTVNDGNKIENQLKDINSEKIKSNADRNNNLGGCNKTNITKIENKRKYKIRRSFKEKSNSAISNQIRGKKVPTSFHNSIVNNTFMFPRESIFSKSEIMAKTAVARWSSYPYASVYIYKPTQMHCDAAGISPHWLIAAGSCLSRHTLVHSLHARSAFVTYCGEHWRRPERIAYVKRSVVHPKFNPRDQVRRLLFNIGLIQVSDSMAACPRWSPITMMSHQFTTEPGSVASAVGWGLDRYGTKHMTEKLPHWPLTVYDAQVYHDTCPGSSAYSMAKRQEGDGTNNVYCLLLPPYTKEESDPVHGGLLLVEGKLVALYLQEERRSWGPQSAQYTGVWRLLPWVMEVALEPDDAEAAFDV